MRSGRFYETRIRIFAVFLACAAVFARGGSFVILFETKKYVSFFDAPIAGKSALASDSGGRVRWQTLEPYVSAMIFDGSEPRRLNLRAESGGAPTCRPRAPWRK